MEKPNSEDLRSHAFLTGILIAFLLLALPLAVWLDLTNLAEAALRRQATDLNSVISSVRGYYATNVVGRVLANPGSTKVVHNYEAVPGAIPIPATLSLELGRVIGAQQENINYRFVSDFPFKNRTPHQLDPFEKSSLDSLRNNPDQKIVDTATSLFSDKVRLVAPVVMGPACVSCHNAHPESPKTDWKVGDVRGIQEVTITQPIAANLFSFKYLLAYFVLAAISGISFLGMQRRQAMRIKGMNRELESANDFLATLSMKISRYISPQVYKSIFSGQKDVTIHTERKKLTIFFSDIQNFTATTERLQPEQITQLLTPSPPPFNTKTNPAIVEPSNKTLGDDMDDEKSVLEQLTDAMSNAAGATKTAVKKVKKAARKVAKKVTPKKAKKAKKASKKSPAKKSAKKAGKKAAKKKKKARKSRR